jgi:hypothetical protein
MHGRRVTSGWCEVPTSRWEAAGRGAQNAHGFGIPVKIVAGRQFDYGYEYGQGSLK